MLYKEPTITKELLPHIQGYCFKITLNRTLIGYLILSCPLLIQNEQAPTSTMKTITIDGNNFNDLDTFFDEAEATFTKDLDWRVAKNFDALNDILYGGFGVFESKEVIQLVWKNSEKSKKDLGYSETEIYWSSKVVTFGSKHKPFAIQKLKEAQDKKGETLYYFIKRIILDHPNIILTEA